MAILESLPYAASAWELLWRNWALVSIVATVAILCIVPVLVLRKYVNIMFNILRDTPPPLSMGPRDFVRIDGDVVDFRALDGLSLRGMFLTGAHGGRPHGLVIFAHEYASDLYSCARYCRPLLAAGYDIFTFDFRGHGESSTMEQYRPRQWVTQHEVADMMGALAYVEDWLEAQGRPKQVGIFGISRGAGAAILAAAVNPNVRAILADSAFSNDTALEALMQRWAYIFAKVRFVYENHPPQFWKFLRWLLFKKCCRKLHCEFPSVRKTLRRMPPRPMLFIHGEKDSYIDVSQSRELFELAGFPKYLWVVAGAKHNQSCIAAPDVYGQRTVAFFHRYLAGISAAELRSIDAPLTCELAPRTSSTRRNGHGRRGRGARKRPSPTVTEDRRAGASDR